MTRLCPYPGLRPFTEEEAIYFKGRERHIQTILDQLQKEKFVMVSGASGDGKSSVVFGGLIPQIHAGFLKSKFNDWRTITIRPENKPLENLINTLSEVLQLDAEKVKKELAYGFSSMLHVYQASSAYMDESSEAWKKLGVEERMALRSKAANVLLVLDQFEEFFTHSENMHDGIPSNEAILVLNLVVEAAHLAKEQDIPFHIICTMRSDFLVNCGSFRGLPELIGQSHYFIPRLNRTELFDVINGPAELNGDRVSKRLTDYLINQTREGSDQLPILQHCLSRLWHTANGAEIDLFHLALIGGIAPDDVPQEFKSEFQSWFDQQSDKKKVLIENGKLSNVINTHAEALHDSVLQKLGDDSGRMISQVFKAIVKQSEGRTVRNRIRLQEILYSYESMSMASLSIIADEFRKDGNSLLSPIDKEKSALDEEDTIDITHEALIRNWTRLNNWASEDGNSYNTFLEFRKQSDRWVENDKHVDFLLPAGPLAYFSNWFATDAVNSLWIAKYFNEYSTSEARAVIESSKDFLEQSTAELDRKKKARKKRLVWLIAASVAFIVSLSALSLWALNEQSIAKKQKLEAEAQKQMAVEAKSLAEDRKSQAEEAEISALKAKDFALEQENVAKEMLSRAEQASKEAIEQRQIALAQSNRAISASNLAAQKADEAELEKQRAVSSEQELFQLSTKTVKEKLLLEISQKESMDSLLPQKVQLAYHFLKENGEDLMNERLLIGQIAALKALNGVDRYENETKLTPSRFYAQSDDILYVDRGAHIYSLDSTKKKWISSDIKHANAINKVVDKVKTLNQKVIVLSNNAINNSNIVNQDESTFSNKVVDKVFVLNQDEFAFATVTGEVFVYSISNQSVITLKMDNAVCTSVDGSDAMLVVGWSNGRLQSFPRNNKARTQSHSFEKQILYVSLMKGDSVLAVLSNGEVHVLDRSFNQEKTRVQLSHMPTDAYFDYASGQLYIGTDNGSLYNINPQLDQNKEVIFKTDFAIKNICSSQKKLFVSNANSDIFIIDQEQKGESIRIRPSVEPLRSIYYHKETLYLGYEGSSVIRVPVNVDKNQQTLCKLIEDDLSVDQWNDIVGENIPKISIQCE